MANSEDDVKDQVRQTKQNIKDAVTLKPQRQAASDTISHAIQGAENTVKGWAGKAADFMLGPADKRPDLSAKPQPKTPSYKDGTDYVPKTGKALLHKGEAVLNKDDASKHREAKGMTAKYDVADELGGKKETKPKKEIKHMHIKHAANGGHIIKHEHTHPEHHPDEEHTTKTDDELASHVLQNMGTPNPGEAEADAGQSGIPGAAPGAATQAPPSAGM
jgi:hypothetical protein